MTNIVEVNDLTLTIAHRVLCDAINFSVRSGENLGLVARNGAGKSTLLEAIAGKITPQGGEINILPDVKVGYLEQSADFAPDATVLDALFHHDSKEGQLIRQYEQALKDDDSQKLAELVQEIEKAQARDYETRVRIVIGKLQLEELLDQQVKNCSGGEVKRLALAKTLIDDPDLLILDEPTNHLDVEMIERLENYLKRSSRTLLFVTHDRYFLDRLADRIIELDHQKIFRYPGGYQRFLELKEKRESLEEAREHKQKQLLRRELERMKKQPKARETKSVRRTKKFYEKESAYKAQVKKIRDNETELSLSLDERRIGGKILNLHNISKSYGDNELLSDFTYEFRKGERVAIVGRNGIGKSTLIRIMMGTEEPDTGTVKQGKTITMGHYEQKQKVLPPNKRVIDIVKDVAEYITVGSGEQLSASKLLELFLFDSSQHHQRAYTLSGGEKRRLHLLTVLIANPNFLILDEPTNDLDIDTLRVLEEFLLAYTGCLVVVSHDRAFVDKVVDHLLVFTGQGEITEFPGSYSDWKATQRDTTKAKKTEQDGPEASPEHPPEKTDAGTTTTGSRSLSNKEREELQFLEEEITRLEQRKEEINLELATKEFTHAEIKEISAELSKIVEQLEQYEARRFELQD